MKVLRVLRVLVVAALISTSISSMASVPYRFYANQKAVADQVNSNFDDIDRRLNNLEFTGITLPAFDYIYPAKPTLGTNYTLANTVYVVGEFIFTAPVSKNRYKITFPVKQVNGMYQYPSGYTGLDNSIFNSPAHSLTHTVNGYDIVVASHCKYNLLEVYSTISVEAQSATCSVHTAVNIEGNWYSVLHPLIDTSLQQVNWWINAAYPLLLRDVYVEEIEDAPT
jgi:hypothetical protein